MTQEGTLTDYLVLLVILGAMVWLFIRVGEWWEKVKKERKGVSK